MSSVYTRQRQQIVEDYRRAGGAWPAKAAELAEWALSHGKWELSREAKLRVCAADLAEAMRQEYITDDSGRRVRTKHAAKTKINGEQGHFWADIQTIAPEFMRVSVAQRRNGIVAECRQLSNDIGYFNKLHPNATIQLVLDFTRDVRELDQPRTERGVPLTAPRPASAPERNALQPRSAVPQSTSLPGPSRPSSPLSVRA